MDNKNQRIVLVTGAFGGIGLAVCKDFLDNDWQVVGVDKDPGMRRIPVRYIRADISKPLEVQKVIKDVYSKEKKLDVLVNNAAYQICKPLVNTSEAEWDKVYAVNIKAAFLFSKGFYKLLREAGGSIVNVASVHAMATSINIGAYASSKGALVSLTRSMAIEFAKDNIRVNAVLPGAVNTPMLKSGLRRGHIRGDSITDLVLQLAKKHPLCRVGTPEEIAKAVCFLADNKKSSFISGQTLIVDGGALAKLSTE